jgi:hypothetical protein
MNLQLFYKVWCSSVNIHVVGASPPHPPISFCMLLIIRVVELAGINFCNQSVRSAQRILYLLAENLYTCFGVEAFEI